MIDSMAMWLPLVFLALLLLTGLPVAYALGLSGVVGLLMAAGPDVTLGVLRSVPVSDTASYSLVTIPMFILMAEFLANGRLVSSLFQMARDWFSPVRGGLAMSVVGANGVFGAMSGSSVAAAGLMGKISVPEMRKYGYSERLALGSVASAGTLAVLIPPSVAMIIYALATDTSISQLFAAGIIPGIATAVAYMAIIYIWSFVSPEAVPRVPKIPWSQRFASLRHALPAIPLLVIVLGGIYGGFVTPSEAGAIGAAGALIVSAAFGGLSVDGMRRAVLSTVVTTGMIVLILVMAGIFSRYLTLSGLSSNLVDAVASFDGAPFLILLAIVALFLGLGMIMSMTAVLILALPLTFPIVMELGYDPLWFGIIVVKTVEIGLVTPPLGMNAFVTHGVAGGKLGNVFSGAGLFLIGDVAILAVLLAAPDLVPTFAGWITGA